MKEITTIPEQEFPDAAYKKKTKNSGYNNIFRDPENGQNKHTGIEPGATKQVRTLKHHTK